MKKYIAGTLFLLLALSTNLFAQCNETLVHTCALGMGDNTTYLKDFKVELKKGEKNQAPPMARFSVILNKGEKYRFGICNSTEFPGEAVLQVYDYDRLLASSFDSATGADFHRFDFLCRKSAVYQVFISFKKGQEGCAVGVLYLVKE